MRKISFKCRENFVHYFPLGLAKAEAFCNRIIEQEILHGNIKTTTHTVLISPRRYGKSSLAIKVIEDSTLVYEVIDLFVAKNAKAIEKHIIDGIQHLINKIITGPEQAIKSLRATLKHLNAKLTVGTSGVNIELVLSSVDSAANILEALQALDALLLRKKQKAIIFIDEFQQLGALSKGLGLEGAIRHVAQETRNIVFIFSGSNRHLLTHMFNDRNRPFYKLCREIRLDRISEQDYSNYLNYIAQKTWGENLSDEVQFAIFAYTDRHPYYMNVLCMRIWMYAKKPTPENVKQLWQDYIFEERSKTINELSKLTANQYFMLNKIAHGDNKQLTGHIFLSAARIPSSSVVQALDYLRKSDYIYMKEDEYYVLDPLLKGSLLLFAETNC
ncbi:MAG: hypothetical protein M1561_08300 [Gammaproteobacteria bacterium]|nr:hypothetical protein [Gammaproteobacteria bacterium]